MNDALFLSPCTPLETPTRTSRLRRAATRVWQWFALDEREAYLSKATDCADLERRLQAWDHPRAHTLSRGTWSW